MDGRPGNLLEYDKPFYSSPGQPKALLCSSQIRNLSLKQVILLLYTVEFLHSLLSYI